MKWKTGVTIAMIGAAGYGAWAAYKKYNPNAPEDVKNAVNKMTRQLQNRAEQSIENMM